MPSEPPDPNDIQAKLQEIYRRQAELYDSLTAALEKELDRIITQVLAALMEQLRGSLKLDDGTVARTPQNLAVLTKLNSQFEKLVTKYGYRRAITAFVAKFPQQFELLSETFQVLSSVLDRKWLKQGTLFRPDDLKVLSAQQLVAKDSLNDLPAQTGVRAKSKVVQLAGSGSLADMQVFLSGAFDGLKNSATSLGETSMVLFYGLANERVYSRIQEGQSAPLVFDYQGPEDVLNRKFCAHLLKQRDAGKRWTREQIDLMDNHQIPDVFVSKGGWRCRHQWILSLTDSAT
jgi:hypothetical protein